MSDKTPAVSTCSIIDRLKRACATFAAATKKHHHHLGKAMDQKEKAEAADKDIEKLANEAAWHFDELTDAARVELQVIIDIHRLTNARRTVDAKLARSNGKPTASASRTQESAALT